MHRRARAWALSAGLMGAVAACGGGSDDSDAAPQGDAGAAGSSAAGAAGAAGSTAGGAAGSTAGGAAGSTAGGAAGSTAGGAAGASAGGAAGASAGGAAGASAGGAAGAGGASSDPCSAPIVGSCEQTTGTHTCVASHHGDATTIKAGCDASKGTFSTSGCPSGSVGHCVLNDANGSAFQSNYYYVPNAQYPSACAAAKGTWCPP